MSLQHSGWNQPAYSSLLYDDHIAYGIRYGKTLKILDIVNDGRDDDGDDNAFSPGV